MTASGPDGVSVVIPHYGDPAMTVALASRLLQHGAGRPLEVIVADDASPSPCPDIPGARVVRRAVNGGFGSAVNDGARQARMDWLLVLNSDTVPEPGFLDTLIAAATPLQPAISSPLLIEGGAPGPTGHRFPSAWRSLKAGLMALEPVRRRWPSRKRVLVGAERVDWVAGAAILLRRDDFEGVGGFDEAFYMYGEDIDLCRRLADRGVASWVLTDVRLEHGLGGSSPSSEVPRWNAAARGYYALKWGFWRRLRIVLWVVRLANTSYLAIKRASGADVRPLERWTYEGGLQRISSEAARKRSARAVSRGS